VLLCFCVATEFSANEDLYNVQKFVLRAWGLGPLITPSGCVTGRIPEEAIIPAARLDSTNQRYVRPAAVSRETFRVSPLTTRRTIRMFWTSEGGGAGRATMALGRDLRLRHCDRLAVEQKFNTDRSGENAEYFTSGIVSSMRSVNCMRVCCCLISEFIYALK